MKITATVKRASQDISPAFDGGHLDAMTAIVVFAQATEDSDIVTTGAEVLPLGIRDELDRFVCQMGKAQGKLGVSGRRTGLWTFTTVTEE